jgi:serine/threonine protein kinase
VKRYKTREYFNGDASIYAIFSSFTSPEDLFWLKVVEIILSPCGTPLMSGQPLVSVFADLVYALRHLHMQGYCHCDVRLANLMRVGSRGLLVDLGFESNHMARLNTRPIPEGKHLPVSRVYDGPNHTCHDAAVRPALSDPIMQMAWHRSSS